MDKLIFVASKFYTTCACTWNFMQCVLLCPLYIICWFLVGRAIGLGVPSMNPQHCVSGAPFLSITWEKRPGSSQIKSRESRRSLNRSWMWPSIWKIKIISVCDYNKTCSTLLFEKRVQCFHNLRVFFVLYSKEKVLETTLVRPRVGGGYLEKLESFFIRQVL